MAALALIAAACATPPAAPPPSPPSAPPTAEVSGQLFTLQRIALPASSRVVVELRDKVSGRLAAQQRFALGERQLPLPFSLALPRDPEQPDREYLLRGAVFTDGGIAWASDELTLRLQGAAVNAGEVRLMPLKSETFASVIRCGKQFGRVSAGDDGVRLAIGGESFEMRQVPAASGSKFEVPGDPKTSFWGKRDKATLVIRGVTQPECSVGKASTAMLRGHGNEPNWTVLIDKGTLSFAAPQAQQLINAPASVLPGKPGRVSYLADDGAGLLTVAVTEALCKDTMGDLPYPQRLRVTYQALVLDGCGGMPADLLRGTEWVVEEIAGARVIERSQVSLTFGEDGALSGRASCNNFRGRYNITGEGLAFSGIAGTRRACAAPLMKQEDAFLKRLAKVNRFDIDADGGLLLATGDERQIVARRK
jgi:heat shock protein HslJ/uncharacterized lipoprotein YbaY